MTNSSVLAEPAPHPAAEEPRAATRPLLPTVVAPTLFRRNLMDRQDPFETSGVGQPDFTVSGSYKLPPEISAQQLADEIRAEIHASLVRGCVAGAEVEIVDFDDARVKGEPPRRFVVTRTRTARKTPVNVNAYFQPYGEHLFYSVRSYTVPRLNLSKLLQTIWMLMLVLSPILIPYVGKLAMGAAQNRASAAMGASFGAPSEGSEGGFGMGMGGMSDNSGAEEGSGGSDDGFSMAPIIFLVGLAVVFRKTLRALLSGDPPSIALRKQFPGELGAGSFDDDDVIAFFKTNLDLTLEAISQVLERHGIDTKALRAIIQNLQTINVNTGGGEIVGAVFGGSGNSASGAVTA